MSTGDMPESLLYRNRISDSKCHGEGRWVPETAQIFSEGRKAAAVRLGGNLEGESLKLLTEGAGAPMGGWDPGWRGSLEGVGEGVGSSKG